MRKSAWYFKGRRYNAIRCKLNLSDRPGEYENSPGYHLGGLLSPVVVHRLGAWRGGIA